MQEIPEGRVQFQGTDLPEPYLYGKHAIDGLLIFCEFKRSFQQIVPTKHAKFMNENTQTIAKIIAVEKLSTLNFQYGERNT
jgi:hypothetical protein